MLCPRSCPPPALSPSTIRTALKSSSAAAWRYSKSELAMESPRVWIWERREKLLLIVTLVYAFLLSLLAGYATTSLKLVQTLLRVQWLGIQLPRARCLR